MAGLAPVSVLRLQDNHTHELDLLHDMGMAEQNKPPASFLQWGRGGGLHNTTDFNPGLPYILCATEQLLRSFATSGFKWCNARFTQLGLAIVQQFSSWLFCCPLCMMNHLLIQLTYKPGENSPEIPGFPGARFADKIRFYTDPDFVNFFPKWRSIDNYACQKNKIHDAPSYQDTRTIPAISAAKLI